MSDILYVVLDMLLTFSVMCALEQEILAKRISRVIIACSMCVMYGVIMHNQWVPHKWDEIINLVVSTIAAYILCEMQLKSFVLIYIISSLIGPIIQSPIEMLLPIDEVWMVKIVSIVAVALLGVLYSKSMSKINLSILPRRIIVATIIMFVSLIVVLSILMIFGEESNTLSFILTVAVILVTVAVLATSMQSVTAEVSKLNLQKENDILQSYNEQQKKYYELVLKSEEDTRRFRHDMMNHMLCLESYLQEGKIEDCKNYISNITDSINHSRSKIYYTGNKISDVMLTNILENKKEDVKVTVTGRLKDDIPIPDFDLCVVVSNIVKNAVEAVNKQADESEKYIKINFTLGKRYLRIEEWNSIDQSQVENAKKFETAKEDKKAHGLGVKNVKMIVQKYDGSFKSEVKNNEFYVCVEMDMKSAK